MNYQSSLIVASKCDIRFELLQMWYSVVVSGYSMLSRCKNMEHFHRVNWSLTSFSRLLERNWSTMNIEFNDIKINIHKNQCFNVAFGTKAQLEQCISNGIHLIVCNNDENKMPIRCDCCVGFFSICKHCVYLQLYICNGDGATRFKCKRASSGHKNAPFTISYTYFVRLFIFCWIASSCSTKLVQVVPFQLL